MCVFHIGKKSLYLIKVVHNFQLPSRLVSNLYKVVCGGEELDLHTLKSHDFHVTNKHVLSFAIRGLLPLDPQKVVIWLCKLFQILSNTMFNLTKFGKMMIYATKTLNLVFTLTFFNPSTHVVYHLMGGLPNVAKFKHNPFSQLQGI